MKKIIGATIAGMALAGSIFAQGVKVPAAAEKAFQQKFPAAKDVKWDKESKNEYEAEFTLHGKKASANFSSAGAWMETESGIDITATPAKVIADFNKKYTGATINEVYFIETKDGGNYYEIEYTLHGKKKEAKINP